MKFFFGLSNPVKQYKKTRHNLGAIIVENLANQYGTPFSIDKKTKNYLSIIHKNSAFNNDIDIHCVISKSYYMNLSGSLVHFYKNHYKLESKNIVIFHDEVELPIHTVSYKFVGGAKGHNGLRDIIKKIGTNQFHRISLGIGRPIHTEKGLYDYVLSTIPSKDIPNIELVETVLKENIYCENPNETKTKKYQ